MSEFTEGILFLNKHLKEMQEAAKKFSNEDIVKTFNEEWQNTYVHAVDSVRLHFEGRTKLDHIIHKLNEKWSAFLPEEGVFMLQGGVGEFGNWIQENSRQQPLLIFLDGEDHGWYYYLFDSGKVKAQLEVNYELIYDFTTPIIETKYPQRVNNPGWMPENKAEQKEMWRVIAEIHEQVQVSEEYKEAVKTFYQTKNVEAFKVFGISDEAIEQLDEILTADNYLAQTNHWEQVTRFKEIMGFPEVSWMSYRYMKKDSEE